MLEFISAISFYLHFHLLHGLCDFLQEAFYLNWDQCVHVRILHFQAFHDALQQGLLGIKLAVDLLKPETKEF